MKRKSVEGSAIAAAIIVIGSLIGLLIAAAIVCDRTSSTTSVSPTQCQEINRLTELAQRGYWYDSHTGLDIMRQLTKLQSELSDSDVCNKL